MCLCICERECILQQFSLRSDPTNFAETETDAVVKGQLGLLTMLKLFLSRSDLEAAIRAFTSSALHFPPVLESSSAAAPLFNSFFQIQFFTLHITVVLI